MNFCTKYFEYNRAQNWRISKIWSNLSKIKLLLKLFFWFFDFFKLLSNKILFELQLWVIPIIWYSYCLIMSAETPQQYWAAWIYGFVLTGLFSVSTIFHAIASFEKSSLWRDLFHRGDRAMIYLFIAGSYTPWLTLKSYQPNGWASQLSWAIWILACLGIIYQQLFHEKYKWLETTIYLTVALAPAIAVYEMVKFWNSKFF